MKVNVLGTEYNIEMSTPEKHPYLKDVDGYADWTAKEIVIHPSVIEGKDSEIKRPEFENDRMLRHELIHAFLFESGLAYDAEWATNETMVDFFARQFPKLIKVFREAGAL